MQSNHEGISMLKEFIRNLKNVMEIGESLFFDERRKAQSVRFDLSLAESDVSQFTEAKKMKHSLRPVTQECVAPMAQSYCLADIEDQSKIVLECQGGQEESSECLYRLLFIQA